MTPNGTRQESTQNGPGSSSEVTRDECRCGRATQPNTNWCSAECYQEALEDSETVIELPCLNDYWWCPGPEGPTVDGEAFGGKCSDCYSAGEGQTLEGGDDV